jgi:citrate synthase
MSQDYDSFFHNAYENLSGQEATKERVQFLNFLCGLLINFEEDPIEPPSSAVLGLAANCGASFTQCASAALNCITDKHFLFTSICDFIDKNSRERHSNIIESHKLQAKKIPGFGHPSIKGEDDRVIELISRSKKLDIETKRLTFMLVLGKKIEPELNIGGAVAAILMDLGLPRESAIYFPLVSRIFGWLKIYNKIRKINKPLMSSHKFLEKHKDIFNE